MKGVKRILGIDPGTIKTGYGLVEVNGRNILALDYGVFSVRRSLPVAERLLSMYGSLSKKFSALKPDAVIVEDVFFGKNFRSAVRIGEARSIVMLVAAQNKLEVHSYPPATIKQAVVGNGRASKQQVQRMVKTILGLREVPGEDAGDALAAVICHCNSIKKVP